MNFSIRKATEKDMPAVWELVHELAVYEKAPEEVATTVETFRRDGFVENLFEVLVAEKGSVIEGIALYYTAYSTWKGKIIYLDDLVVTEGARRTGIGEALFKAVVKAGKEMGANQMRWQVLDWNEPAISFYKKHKAELDPEWINGRIQGADFDRILE